jgi:hypothetical protein
MDDDDDDMALLAKPVLRKAFQAAVVPPVSALGSGLAGSSLSKELLTAKEMAKDLHKSLNLIAAAEEKVLQNCDVV